MNRSVFTCPVCSAILSRDGHSYRCAGNHTYDISKEGYVNLLLANQKKSPEPGDSPEMLEARRSFLNHGYYQTLAGSVTSLTLKYMDTAAPLPMIILDAGCGEGYYTDLIARNDRLNNTSIIYGIDISKDGIKSASKRNRSIYFAVAGIYHLPVLNDSVDIILNIFAPFSEDEFGRILKENGSIISVTPGADHLYELKKCLYDEVYLNDEEFEVLEKFYTAETVRIKYEMNITDSGDIRNLLKMTPYYHKSSHERIDTFFRAVNELDITADFVIRVLKKI